MIEIDPVATIANNKRQLLHARNTDVDMHHRAGRSQRWAGVKNGIAVPQYLEGDRSTLPNLFVVNPDVRDEVRVLPAEVVHDLRDRVRAEAFRIRDSAKRNRVSVDALI